MTNDASFADGAPQALALRAEDADDLAIISALTQDAILPVSEIIVDARARQLALLLNRFRWEDAEAAAREERPYERVRSVLLIHDALRVQSDGITRDSDTVLELLTISWQPGEDGTGRMVLDFAGDGALAVDCECVNVELRDVTRPYAAPSGLRPAHPD
ncbi:MAG: DUF2948 family protein [Paracoccus sp. (in: a-proteobacteria)]|uniref:DUF2948 family protein n=1 Tax=Paracoccus sp. TaxID=267 RepID=UPI0026DFB734|nr:DUF2948 family protein [Paracoccus sp. (in: a-proteobacteria)]MDO5630953.1 DUF2948 family protein [Paracoccus sp. (in: a-proteobacteria)]